MITVLLMSVMVSPLDAPAAGDEPMPSAAEILDAYVEATGGAEVYNRLKTRKVTGVMEIDGQGIRGRTTSYHARPALLRFVFESDALGDIEEGTDGRIAWRLSLLEGPWIMQNEERAVFLRDADFDATVNWRKQFAQVECVETVQIGSRECFKVVATPPAGQGRAETRYYDCRSRLLLRRQATVVNPTGTYEMDIYFDDYRSIDGLKIPHRRRQIVGDQEFLFLIELVEHDSHFALDRFRPPAEIRALLAKDAAHVGPDER